MHVVFFFNDTATTEIYTLALHDALPISTNRSPVHVPTPTRNTTVPAAVPSPVVSVSRQMSGRPGRSEEHTSELQSRQYLVCRLLLEKKTNPNHVQPSCDTLRISN